MAEDNYRHKGMRKKLVEGIREKGITDEAVLKAIEKVPRHLFLDNAFLEIAYEDKAFPIGEGQTISQPFTVAYQTQLLELKSTDKVLEVGTGSGYQASILAEIVEKVYTIERHHKLYEKTKKLLKSLDYKHIKTFYGDGYLGIPAFASYDKILVTAAAAEIPDPLKEQLKIGGMLVIPVGGERLQRMLRLTKVSEREFKLEKFDHFKFVPLLQGKVN